MKKLISLISIGMALASPFVSAKEGAVQCGNLIYAGTKTSECFSDEFLSNVQQKTSIATERRFKPVKLSSEELFKFPFVIMTGEEDFNLTKKERKTEASCWHHQVALTNRGRQLSAVRQNAFSVKIPLKIFPWIMVFSRPSTR